MRNRVFLLVAGFLFLLGSSPAFAQTGKVTGVVTDAQTGEPLVGVQVYLEGTGRGALTSENGRFFIVNIEPGAYAVVAELLGYQTMRVENVQVSIDITRTVDFQLTPQAIAVGEIRVEVEATPLIETQATGTRDFISLSDVTSIPVVSINEALSLRNGFLEVPQNTDILSLTEEERGVTPVRIRGGRNGETLSLIDGVPINNFVFGGPSFQPTPFAIQQLDYIRGGFEAQYGNALSGIINIATREGGNQLAGALEYRTTDFSGQLGVDQDDLANRHLVQGYVSGPVPGLENLRFAISGEENNGSSRVLEFDDEVYDPRFLTPQYGFAQPLAADLVPGWRAFGYDNYRDIVGKATWHVMPTAKLNATVIDYTRQTQPFLFDLLLAEGNPIVQCNDLYGDPEMCSKAYGGFNEQDIAPGSVRLDRTLYTLRWDQTVGRTAYNLVASRFDQSRTTCNWFQGVCLEDRFANTNFNENFQASGVTTDHPTAGTGRFYGGEDVKTYHARGDIQSQVSDHHQVSAGIQYQGHDINYRELRDFGTSGVLIADQTYAADAWEFAFYMQDRIEYDFITVRLGFRVDLSQAADPGLMFANPLDPTNGSTALDVCENPQDWQNVTVRLYDEGTNTSSTEVLSADPTWTRQSCAEDRSQLDEATVIATGDDFTKATRRSQFSPRLGITFPVTANSNLFFNFSRFTQNPLYNNQLQSTGIGTPREGTPAGPSITPIGTANVPYLGNPNLVIEETTMYEIGYLAELFDDFALSLVLFSKDQNGLTGVRTGGVDENGNQIFDEGVTYGSNTPTYSVVVNQDFTTIQGIEVSLRRRLSDYWAFDLNYSLSDARTNAAPPDRQFERANEGDPQYFREVTSEINQAHVFNGSLRVIFGQETPFGSGFWHGFFKNSTMSLIARLASGLPYTPSPPNNNLLTFAADDVRRELNSGTAPATFRLDALLRKDFWIRNVQYGFFLQIINLTDKKNCVQVSPSTGKCDDGAFDFLRRRVGNPVGEGASSTLLDRPQWIGQRRSFLLGARVSF